MRPFLKQLSKEENVSLLVKYFGQISKERKSQGWIAAKLDEFESFTYKANEINKFPNHIHIIPGVSDSFSGELIDIAINKKYKWIHWSERFGIRLHQLLNFNTLLLSIIKPIYYLTKLIYGYKINKYALGAFAQGQLASNDFLKIGVSKKKIKNLFYTIETNYVSKTNYNNKKFICVSSVYKRKGIDLLLKAFSSLNNNSWELIIVGKDLSNKEYHKRASNLNISNKVNFTGAISMAEVQTHIANSAVFVLPTRFDGWAAVLNEAAFLGKPIISTKQCGAAWHLIEEGRNGYRVRANSYKALKRAMQKYIDNPDIINSHGEYSKEIYDNNFTPQQNANNFIESINYFVSISK